MKEKTAVYGVQLTLMTLLFRLLLVQADGKDPGSKHEWDGETGHSQESLASPGQT